MIEYTDNYYEAESAEMVTYLSDSPPPRKECDWKGHMGGILLSFGSETLFLQPGDDTDVFLTSIENTDERWTDEHVIMEYFYGTNDTYRCNCDDYYEFDNDYIHRNCLVHPDY